MPTSLVTGGAGFIGSHLTERLLANGHQVIILDNLSTGRARNLEAVADHPRLKLITGSITDPMLLSSTVRQVDMIFHMAAAVGVKLVADDPVLTIETNIYPTEWLLRFAIQRNCPFFLASTSEVYGKNIKETWSEEDDLHFGPTMKPRWAYGCSKAIDEFLTLAYHRKYGLPAVIGRFFNVVGPRQVGNYGMVVPRFIDQALSGGPIVVYDDGEQVRCFAHVQEVVDSIIALMQTPAAAGEIYNIGSDQPISIRQLAEEVKLVANPAAAIEFLPYAKAYGDDFEDVRRRVPDVTKLKRTLGRAPSMKLSDVLADIVRWKKSQS